MNRRHSSRLFQHVGTDPNPNVNRTLWEHRQKQRRPISRNPFEQESASDTDYGATAINSPPAIQQQPSDFDKTQPGDKTDISSKEELPNVRENPDMEWGVQMPSWLNLFYDLAWTATFSSLTQANKFREPWDSVSYIAFFATAWWLWASQMFYNIDFYTDDWFHLLFIFLQLITFGALAATTQKFDVTNYITHTPGSPTWEPYDPMTVSPEIYADERLTKVSLRVITLVLAVSRVLLLVQHLRVLYYAKHTSKPGRFPLQLFIVPASLIISSGLFFGSFAITMGQWGREPFGAKIKFVLWGVALLVEMIAHIIKSQMEITKGVRLLSHGSVRERLNGITTIILGEGINAIAGTFHAVEQAPGFSKSTAAGIVSCAVIVFFLAYLYFEGAAPLKSVRRRAAWVMMHLPWLLSVILLLEGVKNQLILSNYLGSSEFMQGALANKVAELLPADQPDALENPVFNDTLRPLLLQAGISFDQEYGILVDMIGQYILSPNETVEEFYNTVTEVWALHMQLLATFNTYKTFMENDTVPEGIHSEDLVMDDPNETPRVRQLLAKLLDPNAETARYIMGLCGVTFICLASLNLIQSWPRDRFQWASIFSRYAMGICMLLLLVLNVGKYKTFYLWGDQTQSQQVGVYRWIDASWVLPTLALAYGIQFIIDTILVYAAVWHSNKTAAQTEEPEKLT